MDGARLGYGLMSTGTDVTLQDIGRLCDAFYIGGTKVGALCGEAVVFTHGNAPKRFFTSVKQHGALLAKGRMLGIQFDELFSDDLYMQIGRYAVKLALYIKRKMIDKGYSVYIDSCTNQQFFIVSNQKLKEIEQSFVLEYWGAYDENSSVVRVTTSWATTQEAVEAFLECM